MNITKYILISAVGFTLGANAQPISIPGSAFPVVTTPSNDMRFLMVYPPGGLSPNALYAKNATVAYSNIVSGLSNAVSIGNTFSNIAIQTSDFLPPVVSRSVSRGQLKVAAPFVITNTLSDGFTNLSVYDNLAWGTGSQVEIIKFIDAHTIVVWEPVRISDTPVATNYDIYYNSANLWDVNKKQNDYTHHTHGAITSDGGVGVSTGLGAGDAQTGWGYGFRITEGTNAWHIAAITLGSRGGGLNFEIGGHDLGGNPVFFSENAPFESLELFANGQVSANGITNWRGDLPISSHANISLNATNGVNVNGLLSIKQASRFLPQVNFNPIGQVRCSAPYTLTNTLAYGFTNIHVWDNITVSSSQQYEVISVNSASNLTVFERIQVSDFGGASNYNVYVNSANLYDVNGDRGNDIDTTHSAITSDGGIAVATGAYQAGYGNGLRVSGKTNSWRIEAVDLSGGIGPAIQFKTGGSADNNNNVVAFSTMAPYESLDVIPSGEVKVKIGLLMMTNYPPVKAFIAGSMFYWNSNGANLYLLKSSLVDSNWISTNLIN